MTDPEPWTRGRLRAAWVAGDWSSIFLEYRRITDMSQLELGSLVGMPQSHVSLIENRKRKVTSAEVIARVAEGLQVPGELRGLSEQRSEPTQWYPSPELNERMVRVMATGKVDVSAADHIARVLAEHRRAEDSIGGKELWLMVRSQLDTVTRLLPLTAGNIADRLLLLAAEHAHWLSWTAHQQGMRGPSMAWLDLAHGWAIDSDSAEMRAWIFRVRSFYMLRFNDPMRASRIADAAIGSLEGLSPATASITSHAASLASAAIGDRDRSRRLADQAYAFALQAPAEEDRPAWLYWLDPLRAKLNLANSAYAVRDWATAADLFEDAISELRDYPRDRATYLERLADARRRL